MQNCTLELATLGDLKLVEKPQPVVLAPHDFCNIKASVKVASTENGIIFGNIVYDVNNGGWRGVEWSGGEKERVHQSSDFFLFFSRRYPGRHPIVTSSFSMTYTST